MKLLIEKVRREWKDDKEKSYEATSFSIEGRKGEIYLTEDTDYSNSHDVHMIWGEELRDEELGFLVSSIIDYIPSDHYILSCGESWEQKERMYLIFARYLEDTSCLRVLKDKEGKEHYYPILRKKL